MLRRPLTVVCLVALAVAAGCTAIRPAKPAPAAGPSSAAAAVAPSAPPAPTNFLTRRGSQLELNGDPYRVVGLNAYELATTWGSNFGCGGMLDNARLDAFFAGLPPHSMVRMWAFQGSMATNPTTHQRDWTGLDRVVAAAQRHGQMLVMSLGNEEAPDSGANGLF